MASMRKLNRRLLRWRRYADHVAFNPRIVQPWAWQPPAGYRRAARAVEDEVERRFWDETPEIWLGGPEGEQALIADVLGEDWPTFPPYVVSVPDISEWRLP